MMKLQNESKGLCVYFNLVFSMSRWMKEGEETGVSMRDFGVGMFTLNQLSNISIGVSNCKAPLNFQHQIFYEEVHVT